MQIAESDAMIHEVTLPFLEAPERERHIKASTLVGDSDEGAFAGQHDLHADRFGGIPTVAVFESIAQRVPQRDQQVPVQLRARHVRETLRERDLEEREQLVLFASAHAYAGVTGCDAWIGDFAQWKSRRIARVNRGEERCSGVAELDHCFPAPRTPSNE